MENVKLARNNQMDKNSLKIVVIVLAGGKSERLSHHRFPKQLLKINGKHIVTYCLDLYQDLKIVDRVTLVINADYRDLFRKIVRDGNYTKVKNIVFGGVHRQDSIWNALSTIGECDLVVIQNAVSIFTSKSLIMKCIEMAKKYNAVSAFCHETYSSFVIQRNMINRTLDRRFIGHVRDPQVFNFKLLHSLHQKLRERNGRIVTNDVILAHRSGQKVYLVESEPYNFKITTDIDFNLAKIMMRPKVTRR